MHYLKRCPKCGESKPVDCFTKNSRTKDGLRAWCKVCTKAANTTWRNANRERWASYTAKWKAANPERARRLARDRYRANPGDFVAKVLRWHAENKDKSAVLSARRRARRHKATPAWADTGAIAAIYHEADQLREIVGGVQVDHIVPLKSPLVCGLHAPANLQILTDTDNSRKHNRWWPDMPEITDDLLQLVENYKKGPTTTPQNATSGDSVGVATLPLCHNMPQHPFRGVAVVAWVAVAEKA